MLKIETPRFIIMITRVHEAPTFQQADDFEDYVLIKELRQKAKDDGELNDDDKEVMQERRSNLRNHRFRQLECKIIFKKYRYNTTIEIEYKPFFKKDRGLAKALLEKANEQLRWYRRNVLNKSIITRYIRHDNDLEISGKTAKGLHVFSQPGQFAMLALKKKVQELYNEKKPKDQIKYIGVELEFCAPIDELEFAIKMFNAGFAKVAQLKKDGSLRPHEGETGFELAILLPESNYKKTLRGICGLLSKVGARADDRRCGLHVHLDMRKRKKDVVYSNLIACQSILLKVVDPQRNNNEFCRKVESRKFPIKFNGSREERYKTINAAAYYKYHTLEIRMHHGSVNFRDISNWMDLLIRIGNYKTKIKQDISDLTILKRRFSLDKKMNEFFQDKVCYWQLQGSRPSQPGLRPTTVSFDELVRPADFVDQIVSEDQENNIASLRRPHNLITPLTRRMQMERASQVIQEDRARRMTDIVQVQEEINRMGAQIVRAQQEISVPRVEVTAPSIPAGPAMASPPPPIFATRVVTREEMQERLTRPSNPDDEF